MDYKKTINFIKSNVDFNPKIAIILGSGLGNISKEINCIKSIPYESIPGFIKPTVAGHDGNLIFGYLNNVPIVAMQGRNHYYEGYSLKEITYPIRIMKLLGCDVLITSNAVGGMNGEYNIGDIVIVNDHINLIGSNPLIGPNDQSFGERFVDMSEVYDKEVIDYIINQKFDFKIHQGVLACLSGPTYETPAEYRWLKTIGSDIVGMSTVPEIIVAKHMNMRCFSMSVITDLGVAGNITKVSHDIVKVEAEKASEKMTFILKSVIKKYNEIKNPLK